MPIKSNISIHQGESWWHSSHVTEGFWLLIWDSLVHRIMECSLITVTVDVSCDKLFGSSRSMQEGSSLFPSLEQRWSVRVMVQASGNSLWKPWGNFFCKQDDPGDWIKRYKKWKLSSSTNPQTQNVSQLRSTTTTKPNRVLVLFDRLFIDSDMRLFRGIEGFELGVQRGNLRRNRKCRGVKERWQQVTIPWFSICNRASLM